MGERATVGRRLRIPVSTTSTTPIIGNSLETTSAVAISRADQDFGGGVGDSRFTTTGSGRSQHPSHQQRRYQAGWMEQRDHEQARLSGEESPPTGRRLGSYWRPGGFTCLDRELGLEHAPPVSSVQGSTLQAQQDRQRRTVIRRLFRHRLQAEEDDFARGDNGFPAQRTMVHSPAVRSSHLLDDEMMDDPFFRRAHARANAGSDPRSFDSTITPPETTVTIHGDDAHNDDGDDDGIPTYVFRTDTPMMDANSLSTPFSPRHHYRSVPTALEETRNGGGSGGSGSGGGGGANNSQRPRRTISDLLQLLQVRGQMAQQSRSRPVAEDRLLRLLGGRPETGESHTSRDIFTSGLDLFRGQGLAETTPNSSRSSGGDRPISVVSDGIFLSTHAHGDNRQQPQSSPSGGNTSIIAALSRLDRIQRRIADLYRSPNTNTEEDPFLYSSRRRRLEGIFESMLSDYHDDPAWGSSPLEPLHRRNASSRTTSNGDSNPNAPLRTTLIPMEVSSLTGDEMLLVLPSATTTSTTTTAATPRIPISASATNMTGDFSTISDPRSPISASGVSPRQAMDPRRITLDLGSPGIRRDFSLTDEALASSAMAVRRQTVRNSMMDRQETLMERFRRTSRLVSALRDGNEDQGAEEDRFQIQTTASTLDSNGNDSSFPRRSNGAPQ